MKSGDKIFQEGGKKVKPSWMLLLVAVVWGVVSMLLQRLLPIANYLVIGLVAGYLAVWVVNMATGKAKADDVFVWLKSSVLLFVVAAVLSFLPGVTPAIAFVAALAVVYAIGQAQEQDGTQKLIPAFLALAVFVAVKFVVNVPLWVALPAAYVLIQPTLEGLEAWRKA